MQYEQGLLHFLRKHVCITWAMREQFSQVKLRSCLAIQRKAMLTLILIGSFQCFPAVAASNSEVGHGAEPQSNSLVSVSTNQRSYGPQDDIVATVRNREQYLVVALDRGYLCTVLDLERRANGSWRLLGTCPSTQPTQELGIDPDKDYRVAIQPRLSGLLLEGEYRFVFTYRGNGRAGETQHVYSASFRIAR
jgi:hypothetical protein